MHQCFTNKHPLLGGLGFGLLLLCITGVALAQETRTLNVGSMRYTTNEGMTVDDMSWPAEWGYAESIYDDTDDEELDMLHAHGIIIGVARTWEDPLGTEHGLQVAQASHNKFTDIEIVIVPVDVAFKRTYRNPYPTKVLDGKSWTSVIAAGDPDDPNIPADVVIYSHNETWPGYGMGIDIERWSYAFANEDHDDYIIDEYLFTNTSEEARDSVYFCLTAELCSHEFYPADTWGDYYGVTYWKYAGGDLTADSMRIWYGWDANDLTEAHDTKGRPDQKYGNLREPQYMSYVLIHADTSPTDETDDPGQPAKAGWSERDLSPNLNEETHEGMYEFIAGPWKAEGSNMQGYSIFVDENGDQVSDGMYRILDPDEDVRDWDMLSEQEKSGLVSCGPYNMPAGSDVRIVTAFAGGSISLREAIDLGAAYTNGSPTQVDAVPLPYDIDDPITGVPIVEAGETLDGGSDPNSEDQTEGKNTKDQVIDIVGKKIAFANAAKAIKTWKNAATPVKKGVGDFGIPLAPAAPSLEGTSVYEKVELEWGNEAELDANTGTIAGYRIYRDFKWEFKLPQDTTFVLLKDENDLPAGTLAYTDEDVARGQDYYYYITAVTEDEIESSMFLNMTGTSADRTDEALSPTRTPATATWQLSPEEGGVVVVPNPYHASGDPDKKYSGRRLNFLNLPAYANIHIYTVTGDRVQTLEHDKATGDKDWERQDTFSTMEIVSGVYIYVVEELDKAGGSPTGEKVIGKFVVVK